MKYRLETWFFTIALVSWIAAFLQIYIYILNGRSDYHLTLSIFIGVFCCIFTNAIISPFLKYMSYRPDEMDERQLTQHLTCDFQQFILPCIIAVLLFIILPFQQIAYSIMYAVIGFVITMTGLLFFIYNGDLWSSNEMNNSSQQLIILGIFSYTIVGAGFILGMQYLTLAEK